VYVYIYIYEVFSRGGRNVVDQRKVICLAKKEKNSSKALALI